MAASLSVGIYVARYLGPKQFGLLSYAISFVGLFSVVSTLGLDQIAVRELKTDPTKKDIILGTLFLLKLTGSVIAIMLILLTILASDNDRLTEILILIIAIGLIFQSFNVINFYFQSQVISKYIAFANIFQLSISSIIKISLVVLKANLYWFALLIFFDSVILAIGFLYLFRLHNKPIIYSWRFDYVLAKKILNESWAIAISGVVATVYMKIDQIMIKEMLNAESVGLYSVAARFSEVWYFFPSLILQSLFPAIIDIKNNFKKIYDKRLQQLHDMLSLAAIIVSIIIFIFSDDIISFLYGKQFLGAGKILAVHIWSCLLVFPGNIRAYLIIIENKQVVALVFRSFGAVLNILLNFILIPRMGAIGAAWATLASFILPVLLISFYDPLIRLTVIMTLKSYCLPFRILLYKRSLYSVSS